MKISTLRAKQKESLIAYAVMLPIFLYHFWMVILPSFTTFYASFTEWNGIGSKTFIGLNNYKELFKDPDFFGAFLNNIKWMLIFLTVPIFLGFIIGYFLSRLNKGKIFYRTIYFLPYVISAAIAGKVFATFYNPYFGINMIFEKLGLDFLAIDWLSPKNALYSVAFVDNWHWWGFVLVIFISGLQQIDPSLYEVADVEGCNTLQKMWHITLPGIKNTMIFIITSTMVWSLGTFEYVWVMTKGGPGTELLSTMLYKNFLLKYRAGYASSIAVVQAVLSFVILGVFATIRKRAED